MQLLWDCLLLRLWRCLGRDFKLIVFMAVLLKHCQYHANHIHSQSAHDIIIIPCPHPVGSMVADSWKNNISFKFFCLFTCLVAMLQCYDIACSYYFYVCRLHNCELVHLQVYVATSFDKPLCIEPEIDSLTVFWFSGVSPML